MAHATNADFECKDCFEDLDETRDCLRICNNDFVLEGDSSSGGLLDGCMAATEDSYDGPLDDVDGISDFTDCCRMSNNCQNVLDNAEECVKECMPSCIREAPRLYMECLSDEMEKNPAECGRQSCLDGFLREDTLQDNLGQPGDILEFENLQSRLTTIDSTDLQDCSLLSPFVTEVCNIGRDCCNDCAPELAEVVDCVVNDVIIPFVAIELNETLAECPINTATCQLARRDLSEEQVNGFNSFMHKKGGKQLPTEAQKTRRARALENVEDCEQSLSSGIVLTNATDGGNKFMECVVGAAGDVLSMETDEPSDESGSATAFAAGLVAAIAGFVTLV